MSCQHRQRFDKFDVKLLIFTSKCKTNKTLNRYWLVVFKGIVLQLLFGLVIPDTIEPSDAGTQTDTRRVFVSMFYGYHVVQGSPDRSPFFLFSRVVAACDKRLKNGKLYHFFFF